MSDDALQVLFAPYCGGLARSEALLDALRLLQGQKLEGCRPVAGADGHGFVLSWSDERAPLDVIHCQLFFRHNRILRESSVFRRINWCLG
ncbi:type IV pilus biogenesis protein EbsA [Synechococcus sp. BL107]|uniref:type IV pilus biogenesis protein EbsA n=1 Tax=Synechococcus sp. BL107 TaxID=313625 RepID=UPI0002EC215F|nr:type IV pilus biogenesis protein EbsA [Synechococcus sp. BL107]